MSLCSVGFYPRPHRSPLPDFCIKSNLVRLVSYERRSNFFERTLRQLPIVLNVIGFREGCFLKLSFINYSKDKMWIKNW